MVNFLLKVVVQGQEKLNAMTKSFEELKEQRKIFKEMFDGSVLGRIHATADGMKKFRDNLKDIGGLKGIFKIVKQDLQFINEVVKQTGRELILTTKNGVLGFIKAFKNAGGIIGILNLIKTGLIGVVSGIWQVTVALVASGWGLLLIAVGVAVMTVVAGFMALKRAMSLNVGGVGTSWANAMAKVSIFVEKIKLGFDKFLYKLGPTFKVLGQIISGTFTAAIFLLEGALWLLSKPLEIVAKILNFIANIIQKVINGVKYLVNLFKDKNKEQEKSMNLDIKESSNKILKANAIGMRSSNTSNNITIHTQKMAAEDAPRIGSVMSSYLVKQSNLY